MFLHIEWDLVIDVTNERPGGVCEVVGVRLGFG